MRSAATPHRRSIVRSLLTEVGVLVVVAVAFAVAMTGSRLVDDGLGGVLPVLLACATVPTLVSIALWLDRFEPDSPWLLLRCFLWGSGVAYLVAAWINPMLAARTSWDATAVYGAPVVEEIIKAACLLWILRFRRGTITSKLDGVIFATMIGLGFAFIENVNYYINSLEQYGIARVFELWVIRGLTTPFLHPFFTLATGVAIGMVAAGSFGRVRSALIVLTGLAISMVIHGTWNRYGLTVYPFVFAPAFAATAWFVWGAVKEQARTLWHHLSPEVEAGLLRRQDLDALLLARGGLRDAVDEMQGDDIPTVASIEYRSLAFALASHRESTARLRAAGAPVPAADLLRDDHLRCELWTRHPEHGGARPLPAPPEFVRAAPSSAVAA
ncbi:MAG: putative rane protein [Thermoleophilia bacterium]|nr:putative rane protein [Thermoleophilia bacterium]